MTNTEITKGHRTPRSLEKPACDVFLETLAAGWSVTKSAAEAGHHRRRFYELRDRDEEFAAAWQAAYEAGVDVLRDEIRRRAVDGWDEPVFQKGERVGQVRRFSDTLLIFEAKRRDPAYRDSARVEVTGADGGPVQVEKREVSLTGVLHVLAEAGALPEQLAGPLRDLAAAREVRADISAE